MGLDNGIRLKLPKVGDEFELPEDFPTELDDYEKKEFKRSGEFHVAYWRKCWGIRAAIIGVLHMNADEYEHPVEADDLPALRRELTKFLKPDYWEENADSIWLYDEYFDNMLDIIFNLKWLEKYLKEHPEAHAYFYDSY